jgi:hypothetical protein
MLMFKVPEQCRVKDGPLGSSSRDGNNGLFVVYNLHNDGKTLSIICSDGMGWEHVSVVKYSAFNHPENPTWEDMCQVKNLFWGEGDVVIQIHPDKKNYINNHPNCLHLWRKKDTNDFVELPPPILVGVK